MKYHRTLLLVALPCLTVATATSQAPAAVAAPPSNLTSAVDAIRSGAQCPPLQSDPAVQRAAEMATKATSDYMSHRSAAVPFTDPMPALKAIGYTGTKGKLFAGYGSTETDAIHGLMITGSDTIANCALTQYGVSTAQADDGFTLTAVVLAAP